MQVNFSLSEDISRKIKAKNKDCYRNSILALLIYLPEEAIYIEGFIVSHSPFEHGWCELNNEIIETTPIYLYGHASTYFPGTRFTKSEVAKLIQANSSVPFSWLDNQWGYSHPDYIKAGIEAYKFLGIDLPYPKNGGKMPPQWRKRRC
ncbi:MAG: hypothetical protein M1281_04720 [Chloroflexi bacterium]|nr:hypothetical protein [Chloroflexota bacterium]